MGAIVADCAGYCDRASADSLFGICPAEFAAYFDVGALAGATAAQDTACLANCNAWAAGSTDPSAPSENTQGCRFYHLSAAQTGPASTHCPHAAPASTLCGNALDNFASLTLATCTGANSQYTNAADVLQQLKNTPAGANPYTAEADTVVCRNYHTLAAASGAVPVATHCPHGARASSTCNSATVTGGNALFATGICDSYCDDYVSACPAHPSYIFPASLGLASDFATQKGACMAVCLKQTQGVVADTQVQPPITTATAACRSYHAKVSARTAADATTHCQHAGYGDDALGGAHCGTSCDFYCQIYTSTCNTAAGSTWTDLNDCLAQCNAWIPNMPAETPAQAAATLGVMPDDTRTCRAYHATAAVLTAPATTHCPHANAYGGTYPGGVCGTAPHTFADLQSAVCAAPNISVAVGVNGMTVAQTALLGTGVWSTAAGNLGTAADVDGDTFGCHLYHVNAAYAAKTSGNTAMAIAHCLHSQAVSTSVSATGAVSAGPCVSTGAGFGWNYYCDLEALICPTNYATNAACLTAVATFPAGAALGVATSGDTLDCRFYHLTAAAGAAMLNDTANQMLHCGHSGATPTGFCVAAAATGATGATDMSSTDMSSTAPADGLSGSSAVSLGVSAGVVAALIAAALL